MYINAPTGVRGQGEQCVTRAGLSELISLRLLERILGLRDVSMDRAS